MSSTFYRYFKQNMDALNLPAPESLFQTLQAAVSNATIFMAFVDRFGTRVTVGELIGAGTGLEGLATIGACSAAYYVGAVIGSIAVATGRTMAGGVTIADVLSTADLFNLHRSWLIPSYLSGR
ncbi:hypothetical protein [Geomonas sp. Red276]